jgi:hypothetical protein
VCLSPEGPLAAGESEHVPVAGEEALLGGQPGAPGEVEVGGELAQLAVDGERSAGDDRLEHPPLLRPRRVAETWSPGSMPACTTRAPAASSALIRHAHRPLVSGDGPGAEEHRVASLDAQPSDLGLDS